MLLAGLATAADPLPAAEGWVTDLAGFLDARREQSLERLMESYKVGSGHEIALLTVPDLGGRSLERYALEIGRTWGLGEQGKHNGALLLVARDERKLRIEVGRGLEGSLTDAMAGRIIRNVITPAFREGRFAEGLRAGVEAMHAAAGGDYAAIPEDRGRHSKRTTGVGLLPLLIFVIIVSILSRRGGRGGGGGGGVLPWLLWSALNSRGRVSGWHRGGSSSGGFGGGFGGFGGGGGFSGGGASGSW